MLSLFYMPRLKYHISISDEIISNLRNASLDYSA